jgi:hypothetical protein
VYIEAINLLNSYDSDGAGFGVLANKRRHFLALLACEQLGVFDVNVHETARQNNRSGNHRSRQRAAAYFIQASNALVTTLVSFLLEAAKSIKRDTVQRQLAASHGFPFLAKCGHNCK